MTLYIKNSNYALGFNKNGLKTFIDEKEGKALFSLIPLYEFALQVTSDKYTGLITSDVCDRECLETEKGCGLRYGHALFDMDVNYSMEEDAAYKKLRLRAKEKLTIRYAQTELSRTRAPLERGGEGQPVFVADKAFVSIVFPAAQNYIDNDVIRLEQAAFVTLEPGEEFEFFPIVYGLPKGEGAADCFQRYIRQHRRKSPRNLRIYSDWGAHDELANETRLDEEMALHLLGHLKKAKEQGVDFDYYLMDAQWFEAEDLYKSFKKNAWPHGPERFLKELENLGMRFGLWFDVNFGMMKIPEDAARYNGNMGRMCLGDKKNAQMLFQGIRTQMKQCGCTMLKLDFAFFDCQDVRHSEHSAEKTSSKEPAIRNFLEGLSELYCENPDLIVLGYNGFTTDLECIASIDRNHQGYAVSPWWCLYMNYVYCGDPRPAEFPVEKMGKSLIYYTDGMIRYFRESLMPYSAIDDHGTMIGDTNTIYYLGKECFRDSWMMNLSRGEKRTLLYGELELLREEDWRFIRESQEMFQFVCREDVSAETILGDPRKCEVYGYHNYNVEEGYITLVNPFDVSLPVLTEIAGWKSQDAVEFRKYYSGGVFPQTAYEPASGGFSTEMAPYEISVFHWRAKEKKDFFETGCLIMDVDCGETITVGGACGYFSLYLTDDSLSPERLFGKTNVPVEVTCQTPGIFLKRGHERPIWSGCSWAVYQVEKRRGDSDKLVIRLDNRSGRRLRVKWYGK